MLLASTLQRGIPEWGRVDYWNGGFRNVGFVDA